MSKLSLSQELVNDVVNYLARRPYAEVTNLLDRLSSEVVPQVKETQAAAPQLKAVETEQPATSEASNAKATKKKSS